MDQSHTHQTKIVKSENTVSGSFTACQARSYSDKEGKDKFSL